MESDRTKPSLAELLDEISGLRDLFQRRLLEDKVKGRQLDELYKQLEVSRGGFGEQLLGPVLRAVLLVVDRIRSLVPPEGDEALESVADELLELLQRQGVRAVPEESSFDPRLHEAVRSEPVDGHAHGDVLDVLRPGYLLGAQLLRPAQVVVASSKVDQPR